MPRFLSKLQKGDYKKEHAKSKGNVEWG